MIVNTSAMLDEGVVSQAVEIIKTAPRIYIFSSSVAAFAASEFEFKLSMVGLNVKLITDTNNMRMLSSGVQANDLVAAVVPTIYMRDIYQSINMCKERGAKILSITSHDSPKLSDLVDFKFVTSDKITARNSLSLSNNLMSLYVVDVLYGALLESDKNLRQKKLNSDVMLGSNQMIDNYMIEF